VRGSWRGAAADGQLGTFTFNLLTDPYWVGSAQPGGIGGNIKNWFADKTAPVGPLPTGVAVIGGADSASARSAVCLALLVQ
jgi:hypothetical protein